MLIYIAGPYSAPTEAGVSQNIAAARSAALRLWQAGHAVICPHLNTAHFEERDLSYEAVLVGDLAMIARCDGIYMLDTWQSSPGARRELVYAELAGLFVFHEADGIPALHPTEERSPVQAAAFMRQIMRMYRTHLSKNHDYSPANILATGMVGLVTRLWDKTARLMNLSGFRFEIVAAGTYDTPRAPKHESIEDTLDDTAVYAVIGRLLLSGEWGR